MSASAAGFRSRKLNRTSVFFPVVKKQSVICLILGDSRSGCQENMRKVVTCEKLSTPTHAKLLVAIIFSANSVSKNSSAIFFAQFRSHIQDAKNSMAICLSEYLILVRNFSLFFYHYTPRR